MERVQVCFDKLGFVLFIDSLKDTFGSAGESMIFQMSKNYGKYLIQSVAEMYSGEDLSSIESSIGDHLGSVRDLGWGAISYELMDWENGRFIINVDGNVFREDCKNGKDSMCYFVKGVMMGTMEEMTGYGLSIKVTECYKEGEPR
jgi:predicted hydrocarbon binding protein